MKEHSIWSISRGTRKCGIYEKVSLINFDRGSCKMCGGSIYRADSRLVPSQWETSLQSNAVSRHLSLAGPKPRISPDLSLFPYKIMTINRLRPKQNGLHFTDGIFKCIFLTLLLRVKLTIFQHWFRQWLGTDKASSHYLNQWWLDHRCIYASLGLNE